MISAIPGSRGNKEFAIKTGSSLMPLDELCASVNTVFLDYLDDDISEKDFKKLQETLRETMKRKLKELGYGS